MRYARKVPTLVDVTAGRAEYNDAPRHGNQRCKAVRLRVHANNGTEPDFIWRSRTDSPCAFGKGEATP